MTVFNIACLVHYLAVFNLYNVSWEKMVTFAYFESFNSNFFMMNMHFVMRENHFLLEKDLDDCIHANVPVFFGPKVWKIPAIHAMAHQVLSEQTGSCCSPREQFWALVICCHFTCSTILSIVCVTHVVSGVHISGWLDVAGWSTHLQCVYVSLYGVRHMDTCHLSIWWLLSFKNVTKSQGEG